MKKYVFAFLFIFSTILSCTKPPVQVPQSYIVGQWKWVIQYQNNPYYFSTPQSTGIQESLIFNTDLRYTLIQNGSVVNYGTYKTSTATSTSGETVLSILYSNSRITDSAAYYTLSNNNDSLFFSHDLIGTVGSGSRHYGRE